MPAPAWFRVAALTLAGFMGLMCVNYFIKAQAGMFRDLPPWVTSVYAISVWFGLAGALLLTFRRRIALHVLSIAAVAVIAQQLWVWLASGSVGAVSAEQVAVHGLSLFAGIAGVVLAWFADRLGWLRSLRAALRKRR